MCEALYQMDTNIEENAEVEELKDHLINDTLYGRRFTNHSPQRNYGRSSKRNAIKTLERRKAKTLNERRAHVFQFLSPMFLMDYMPN